MGYKVGRTFSLEFEGTDLHGAVVKIRSQSIGVLKELISEECTVDREMEILAEHLLSWNLETEDGAEIPATVAGVEMLEVAAKNLILREWRHASTGLTAPLDRRSSDGEKSEEPEIMMETL